MRTLTFALLIFTLLLLYILIIINDESRNILTRDEFIKEIINKHIGLSSTFDYEHANFYHLNPVSLCNTNNKNESF